jgi:integrase
MQLTVLPFQPQPLPSARDVFDSLEVWLSSPDLAFASWVNRQNLKASTKTVYIAMFRKWVGWLKIHGVRLEHVDQGHLRVFLDGENLDKHHRHRYVRLIERAFNHLAAIGYQGANPGSRAAKNGVGEGHNDPTRFLTRGERDALIALVQERIEKHRQEKNPAWTEVRDTALVAAMLGGGLRVSQAQAVTVNCIAMPEGWMALRGERRDRPHRARLLPFARDAIAFWLEVRRRQGVPGDLLFPAQRRAAGFHPKRATEKMHSTSVFRRAGLLMAAAGIQGERACAQTLRNTYGALLLEEGLADDLITEYMGFFKLCSAQRMREAHKRWSAETARQAAAPAAKEEVTE